MNKQFGKSDPQEKEVKNRANFRGDWTLLLRKRLLHPEIKRQQLKKTEAWLHAPIGKILSHNEITEETLGQGISTFRQHLVKLEQTRKFMAYEQFIHEVFKSTDYMTVNEYEEEFWDFVESKISTGINTAGLGNPGVIFKDRLFLEGKPLYTHRQINTMESHEKGHGVRAYIGQQKEEIESTIVKSRLGSKKNQNYLFDAEEIIERMSGLKNYFGFGGDEKFTKMHLDYARRHYIRDIRFNCGMSLLIRSIIDEGKFLDIMNTYGV